MFVLGVLEIPIGKSRDKVERLLAKVTPAGTSVARALHVLDSLNVEHSDLTDSGIYANFGHSRASFGGNWGVFAVLSFDSSGKLVRCTVEEKWQGL